MTRRPLFALAAALLTSTAMAEPVVIHGFSNGSANIDTTLSGTIGVGRLMGERNGGAANSFLTYCTDLFQSFSWNTTYTDYALVANGAANGFTLTQADRLGKLYTLAGNIANTNQSVAFQLAVWEIVHETGSALNVNAGSFAIESGGTNAQKVLANNWLTAIQASGAANSYDVQRLYSPTHQDFIVASLRAQPDTPNRVPEPASLLLAASALAGLFWARRSARG